MCVKILYKTIIFINKLFEKTKLIDVCHYSILSCVIIIFHTAYNHCVLKSESFLRCVIKSKKSHKSGLCCYLHIYRESTKTIVHLSLHPRGRSPQIKHDNVHMKKRHHHHWTCITPFITQLTATFIFSALLSPLIVASIFFLLPLTEEFPHVEHFLF